MTENTFFPDGVTKIDSWFDRPEMPKLSDLGKQYLITDYEIDAGKNIQTDKLQSLIDMVHDNGGGVILVPAGEYYTGALFFKQGVNLYLEKGAVIKGSDDISDYPLTDSRIEGQNCKYFSALINADGLDGFTICGEGAIDGNGLRAWKAFWLRREWNPDCTNKDEQRARLIYISNSKNVTVAGVTVRNSQFWSNHLYKCERVRYINVTISAPSAPVAAPSSDALDIDVCRMVHVIGCSMSVNDDAVCLKGGKGLGCDKLPENGASEQIIVEDCSFGFCHSCVTLGSECIHGKNLIIRNCVAEGARDLLRFKMRPDTPQLYEDVLVENVDNTTYSLIDIKPWTQFYEGNDAENPTSMIKNVTVRKSRGSCIRFLDVALAKDQFTVENFFLQNLNYSVISTGMDEEVLSVLKQERVKMEIDPLCAASGLGIDADKIM